MIDIMMLGGERKAMCNPLRPAQTIYASHVKVLRELRFSSFLEVQCWTLLIKNPMLPIVFRTPQLGEGRDGFRSAMAKARQATCWPSPYMVLLYGRMRVVGTLTDRSFCSFVASRMFEG